MFILRSRRTSPPPKTEPHGTGKYKTRFSEIPAAAGRHDDNQSQKRSKLELPTLHYMQCAPILGFYPTEISKSQKVTDST